MADVPVLLVGPTGEPLGRLRGGALSLIARAEETAREQNLSKRTALPAVLQETLENAGYSVGEEALAAALQTLDALRRGQNVEVIRVEVRKAVGVSTNGSPTSADQAQRVGRRGTPAPMTSPEVTRYFEAERSYPHPEARAWYERLVGLDGHKEQMLVELEMLLYPERLKRWSKEHHDGQVLRLAELYGSRVPLVLLEGDVGTGKTALAETIGDALARSVDGNVRLLKVNTQVRGTGQVGEMSDMIVQAFSEAERRASSAEGGPVLLLLDEADALAASRDAQQMHHEDKAGLNTLLQRLDNLRLRQLPLVAIFITNRPEALDPAVRRRAALVLRFERPSDAIRGEIISSFIPELNLMGKQLAELVRLTGSDASKNDGVSFTASDLTDRLLPGALRAAYRDGRALTPEDLLGQARAITPTPPFGAV